MTAEVDMKKTIQRALAILGSLASLAAFPAESVAFLTNLKGEVTVDGSKARLLSELARGQKVVVAKDAQASVMFIASGKEYPLRGPGEFVVNESEVGAGSGPAPTARATEWRANARVLGQVGQTSAASVRMRSIAPPKAVSPLVFPTQGNIATLQPTFRWTATAPAEITLSVVGEEKAVHAGKAVGNSYRVPAKLKPDTEYAWVVRIAGSELGSARFRTLPSEAIQVAEKRKPSERAEFSDRVMYALMLQDLGASQEAQEQWSKLAKERADLPELATLAGK
ncbi:hypothetical protein BWI17_02965 [Betaproteobacteria bacterium GR16-43]|nr:hypothetical protein BWI17_02965 [Betaproteobacteria bacterium GR16-43]